MNWTASRDPDIANEVPAQPPVLDLRALIEEIARAIAAAQAALFAGRIQDLETCIIRQRELCGALTALQDKSSLNDSVRCDLVATAKSVREQGLLFGAVLRRMRRHLDTLRNLLNGLSLTYQPKPVKVPGRES